MVRDIELDTIESVTSTEIYEFLHYVTRERANSPAARARKLSSLKGFYKYLLHQNETHSGKPNG